MNKTLGTSEIRIFKFLLYHKLGWLFAVIGLNQGHLVQKCPRKVGLNSGPHFSIVPISEL
jgi:hypothetical protein